MRADPYLFFDGRCAEAFEFYRDSLRGRIQALVRFRDMPGASSGSGDRVMHAALNIGDTTILGSDGPAGGTSKPGGFSISLQVEDDTEAEREPTAAGIVNSDDGECSVSRRNNPDGWQTRLLGGLGSKWAGHRLLYDGRRDEAFPSPVCR
jgi:PhnB protein